MSRLAGIHDLAYCFQRLGGAGSAGYSGDWVGLAANLGALAGKAAWYAKGQNQALKTALEKVGKNVLPTPTAIIDVTMVVISIVDLFNGFGPPDKGAGFGSGVDKWENVDLLLEGAIPDDDEWNGVAAKAYTDQTEVLRTLVATMIELDKQMQTLVANQGSEVQKAHTAISVTLFGLVVAQGIALVLYLIPVLGPELSFLWQVVTAFAAGATTLAFEMFTLNNSMSVTNQINAVALEYGEVAKQATPSAIFAKIEVAGAQETTISSFTAISEGLSEFASAPSVASLASVASVAGERSAADADAKFRILAEEEIPVGGTPEAPETPIADAPATPSAPAVPAFTLPTMAQVSQTSAQTAQISGHASQHMNLVNQTMGSVQSLASMGQQGQGAVPPAEEVAAEEAADAGAAAGAETSERAPIDAVTVGAEEGAGLGATPGQESPRQESPRQESPRQFL